MDVESKLMELFDSIRRRNFNKSYKLIDELNEGIATNNNDFLKVNGLETKIKSIVNIGERYLPKEIKKELKYLEKNINQIYYMVKAGENIKGLKELNITPDDNILFFLGAGASVPDPSSIPGVNKLLDSLWEKAEKLDKPELDELYSFCDTNSISNIEDLLTAAYIADFCVNEPNIYKLLGKFMSVDGQEDEGDNKEKTLKKEIAYSRDTINTLFSLLCGTMISAKPNNIHKSIVDFEFFNKSIITTNYDICMDTAIDSSKHDLIYEIEEIENESKDYISLIKMHGSINWFYCNACQHTKILGIKVMNQIIAKEHIYAVTGMCPECSALINLLLVPPTSFKYVNYPTLIPLWNLAQKRFKDAKIIIFIGYSFSDSDDYIFKMVTDALRNAIALNEEIYLLVFDISQDSVSRLKKRIKLHVEKFDQEKNLISFIGDANELVPKALNELNVKTVKSRSSSPKTSEVKI